MACRPRRLALLLKGKARLEKRRDAGDEGTIVAIGRAIQVLGVLTALVSGVSASRHERTSQHSASCAGASLAYLYGNGVDPVRVIGQAAGTGWSS
jgi:hypothetical protein